MLISGIRGTLHARPVLCQVDVVLFTKMHSMELQCTESLARWAKRFVAACLFTMPVVKKSCNLNCNHNHDSNSMCVTRFKPQYKSDYHSNLAYNSSNNSIRSWFSGLTRSSNSRTELPSALSCQEQNKLSAMEKHENVETRKTGSDTRLQQKPQSASAANGDEMWIHHRLPL